MTRFALDPFARRLDHGRVLLGGSPLRLFRLSGRGAEMLDRIEQGEALPPGSAVLTDRLLDAGVLHPRPDVGPFTTDDVTLIVPVRDHDPGATIAAAGPVGRVLVVDDGSDPPVASTETVVRRAVNGGPAAARNTGLADVTTPLVAFLDADSQPENGWLNAVLPHFADQNVVVVAPRVASPAAADAGLLARYESVRSPLDLGSVEGRVRARGRVAYVPAAALVARTDVLRAVGGFDEALRVGEDVDLVWRLDEAGRRVRYEPRAVVRHEPRSTLRRWITQRVGYGRSAGLLARRHPGALAPIGVSVWSVGAWVLVLAGAPAAGLMLVGGTALALARKLAGLEQPNTEAFRLAGQGTLYAGQILAGAVTRVWWPVALGAALVSRRTRRALVVVAVAPAAIEWARTRPPLDPVRYIALRLLDDAAYGAGVWLGCWDARTIEPLVPDLTSWPKPDRYDRRAGARPEPSRP